MTHYDTLGVKPDATPDEIRAAARRASSAAHPDRQGGSHDLMQAVNKARDILLDPERRAQYDATGGDKQGPTIEQRATELLIQMFDAALDQEEDPVQAARRALGEAGQMIGQQILRAQRRVRILTGRRGTVKVKGDVENHVEALIDRKVAMLDAEIVRLNDSAAVRARVVELLDNYEGPAPVRSPFDGIFAPLPLVSAAGYAP